MTYDPRHAAAEDIGQRLSAGNPKPWADLVRSLGLSTHFPSEAALYASNRAAAPMKNGANRMIQFSTARPPCD